MVTQMREQRFFMDQIQEIRRYVQRYPSEMTSHLVWRWIEEHAAEYRRLWESHHPTFTE